MSSIWNIKESVRTGHIRLLGGGRELFGTVVRSGRMNKTVTVKVDRFTWNRHYNTYYMRWRNFHAHDPENFCHIGDKVVIKTCKKLSPIKHYFVRNIVLPIGRPVSLNSISLDEIEAIKYNNKLRSSSLETSNHLSLS
jgi:small subunit ribosomal protein S17